MAARQTIDPFKLASSNETRTAVPKALAALDAAIQAGTATLVNGVVVVTPAGGITTGSVITLGRKSALGTVGARVEAPTADRNVGAGTFTLRALDAAGAAVTTDQSIIDWIMIG